MPKLKSHRGGNKRFKITGRGKIKRWKAYGSHLLTKKNRKRKRKLKSPALIDQANFKQIRSLIYR